MTKLTVTQDDIDKGGACDPWNCPIARCANRTFPGKTAHVGLEDLTLYDAAYRSKPLIYALPTEAKAFICVADCDYQAVKPIEFEIDDN